MMRNRKFALLLAATLALSAVVLVRFVPDASARSTPAPAPQTQKPIKARFEVLHMMSTAIQVRSLANEKEIHTFTYSDQIRDEMQSLFNEGGYQYGDKVVIWYQPGRDVALRIKGKPSKPI